MIAPDVQQVASGLSSRVVWIRLAGATQDDNLQLPMDGFELLGSR